MADKEPSKGVPSEGRLGSPDDLDQLIQVVSPRSWVLLTALLAPLLILSLWSVWGNVRTTVGGHGIILGGAIYDVAPLAAGNLKRLLVEVGAPVTEGELLAELDLPELQQQIEAAQVKLAEQRARHLQLVEYCRRDAEIETAYLHKQRAIVEQSIRDQEAHVVELDKQLQADQQLLASGLISPQELARSKQSLVTTREGVQQARAQLTQLRSTEFKSAFTTDQKLIDSERSIVAAERALVLLERDLQLKSRIVSPCGGRVLELLVEQGSLGTAGQPVIRIARPPVASEPLRVVFYVGGEDGKRIVEGMAVHVAPVTARVEEHGYIIGRVARVGEYPVSVDAMRQTLKNEALVSELMNVGLPFEVVALLDSNPDAPSGHQWTSGRGPDLRISNGTPANALVIVATRRPAELALPMLRRFF